MGRGVFAGGKGHGRDGGRADPRPACMMIRRLQWHSICAGAGIFLSLETLTAPRRPPVNRWPMPVANQSPVSGQGGRDEKNCQSRYPREALAIRTRVQSRRRKPRALRPGRCRLSALHGQLMPQRPRGRRPRTIRCGPRREIRRQDLPGETATFGAERALGSP